MFKHEFWDHELVPLDNLSSKGNEYIETPDTIVKTGRYSKEPILLNDFVWDRLDLTSDKIRTEVSDFLANYYIEDVDNTFRLKYSPEFLNWALIVPGFQAEWFLGVRLKSNRKLVACIMGTPITVRIYDKEVKSSGINFLCIHPKLRNHRLTPILIYTVSREIVLKDRYHSIYTGSKLLPTPISTTQFYHRYLNVKNLYEMNFFPLRTNVTLSMMIKTYRLPEQTKYEWVPLTLKDVPQITNLIQKYFCKFDVVPVWSPEEITHYFLPRDGILKTYVRKNKDITDIISFYELRSTIIRNSKHKELRGAWVWYMIPGEATLKDIMSDALILAKNEGYDVFNCMDIMEYPSIFSDLKFNPGTGRLHYYFYNWNCSPCKPNRIGLVLV